MNKLDFAKKALALIEQRAGSGSLRSTYILAQLEMPVPEHNSARGVLKRLADMGILQKSGYGRYNWKLINKNYNRDNPFRTPVTAQPQQPKPEPEPERRDSADPGPVIEKLLKKVDLLEDQVAKLKREIDSTKKTEIVIKDSKGKELKTFKERVHPIFEQVMFHVQCGDNVMLVGPKGCGKTYLAEQLADSLGRRSGIFPISGGVTEGKLFGRVVPNINTGKSEYQETLLVDLIENGGLGLIDEVDAGDPNVLISLNSLLANGSMTIDRPKKPKVERHKDFICLAAANTWGNGADRQYVGRNQMDAAFTERFVQIEMDYDRELEMYLCKGATELCERLHRYRDAVVANKLERTISTRLIVRAKNWFENGKDPEYIDKLIFAGWRTDEIRRVKG